VLAPWLALLPGCVSLWEENFRPNTLLPATAPPTQVVVVRQVPWQRIDATLTDLNNQFAASAVSPIEWSEAQKEQIKAALLVGLQVSEPPSRVLVLGSSRFWTTQPLREDDPALRGFAQRIGANLVIWSNAWLGKADRVETEPVTSFTWFNSSDPWFGGGTGQSTTWVPVVVQANEFAWAVFFLRVEPG
jgi:hypothetical protein